MPRATPILTNFTAGEWSSRLDGRVDLAKYANACKTLENLIILPHGGATRRPGTYYVAAAKNANKRCRLVPFEFSVEQAYILEFGDQYIRFFKDNGQIVDVDSYTKLLLHCNGYDASQVFTDSGVTGHTITAYGNAKIWTASKKFGTGCVAFLPPTSSYISVADHADWFYDAGKFTIEFWHYPYYFPTVTDPDWGFCHQSVNVGGVASGIYMTWHYKAADGKCYLRVYIPITGLLLEGEYDLPNVPPADRYKWRHIALMRGWGGNANDWALCVDGAAIDTATDAQAITDLANAFEIGRCRKTTDAANYWYCGQFFDEFRVSKGVARWTAAFTPPDREYPTGLTGGGGGAIVEVTTTYLESELRQLQFAQSADILYITHPNHAPRKLSRTSHVDWVLSEIDFIDGPYDEEVEATVTSSAVSGLTTLTLGGGAGVWVIFYDAEVAAFTTIGQVVTGTASTATAKLLAATDWGGEGVLVLGALSGTFQNNEQITGAVDGDATVNGTVGDGYITYNTEVGGPFQVGETITGGTSRAIGILRGLQDDGATGKLSIVMGEGSSDFIVGETITGGTSEATASVTVFLKSHGPLFTDADVGARFRYFVVDTWYWLEIKAIVDDVTATAVVRGTAIPAGPANATKYRKGTWKIGDYPACVTFHEQRLLFGGSPSYPQTLWGSEAGDYENFVPGVDASNPFTYSIASGQMNAIKWLSSGKVLMVGTAGAEYIVRGTGTDDPITPTNILVKRETTHGCTWFHPVRVSHAILFLQRQERKVRELVYNWEYEQYDAPDMTILAEHITKGGIYEMAYQQEPDSVIWCIRADGVLLGMTYYRPEDVIGWHRHITGTIAAPGYFESVAVIPYEGYDQVWVAVRREINGSTYRYIEVMTPSEWDEATEAIFVDSALTYEGAPVSYLTGLSHLEGETVSILTDKGVHPDRVVEQGYFTLDWEVTKVHVGLRYDSKLQTMRLEAGQIEGTAQAKMKRIHKVTVRLYETIGCKVGPNATDIDTIPFRKAGDPMDALPPLFTGDKDIVFRGGYEKEGYMWFIQDQPLPMTVLAIIPHMATADD